MAKKIEPLAAHMMYFHMPMLDTMLYVTSLRPLSSLSLGNVGLLTTNNLCLLADGQAIG